MGRRHRLAVYVAAIVLMVVSISGYAEPPTSPAKTVSKEEETKPGGRLESQEKPEQIYVVQRGDSLFRIARNNQTTVKTIQVANGLKGSAIKAGQTLIIPGSLTVSAKEAPVAKSRTEKNAQLAEQYISQLRSKNPVPETEEEPLRLRLVEAGFKMLGVRYKRSGGSEKTGFDCSGLVKNLFSQFDIDLPRTSKEQYKQGEAINRDELQIGDLVFFSSGGKRPTHVGIYVGDDQFLHAAIRAKKVIVSDLNKFWYTMRYLGARRIAELWWDETETSPEEQ
jgi:cell wall-associated NlpC family hydrolase